MEKKTRIAGIIIKDGKLLMVKGKKHDELWTPGGKVEAGESDQECLKRELKEEIGANLLSCRFFTEYTNPAFYHPEQMLTERVYIAEIEGDVKPDAEIESIIWFGKEDFESKKFPMITHDAEILIPDLIKEGIW